MSIDDRYIYPIQIEALLGTETGIYRMGANQTRRTDEVVCVGEECSRKGFSLWRYSFLFIIILHSLVQDYRSELRASCYSSDSHLVPCAYRQQAVSMR